MRLWAFEADIPKKMRTFAARFYFTVRNRQAE